MEEYLAILQQRIYTKRLPSSLNVLDHSIDNIEKLLTNSTLHKDKRATISSQGQKLIAQCKCDIMTFEMTTIKDLVRTHTNMIVNEKKKLIDSVANGQVPLPKSLVPVLNAIAARQSNIIKRAQLITKHKISFFDDAPTVVEEEIGTVGAIL